MYDVTTEATNAGCTCLLSDVGQLRAVWLSNKELQELEKADQNSTKKLREQIRHYCEHGLGAFSPPRYEAYRDYREGDASITLGRFSAKRLRAIGYEINREGWTIFVISCVIASKKTQKVPKKFVERALRNGWEIYYDSEK